ncbi:DNA topoisomerase 3-beta isoform X3 [Elaeis guineensis]|uniref:DNA topoisomerase n=1 Tax=Elaeis guineensis var. tenera TaxID=51953 RepID=A0A6I9RH47_ELAGV|nr:DNA topoisomerase 3-beta isoform X3 [Elaeis guineensis]
MAPRVLMVAEKPSIALSIASALSGGRMSTRRGSTDVHEFDGMFRGLHAHFKVTSVIGHIFSVDFPPTYQNWEVTDPMDLFQAPILKSESNPKAHIRRHLSQEAKGCGYLVLWLDCDREGENICYEVIECSGIHENEAGRRIYRARFSSVAEKDILKAMDNLVAPNKDEALAVDARQEIDLKVGVAFTRFQTRYFQGKYGNLDSRVISYGPCQTPTLGFCVQRYLQITTFKPEKFWSLNPYIIKDGYELRLEWDRNKLFDYDVAMMFQKLVSDDHTLKVTDILTKEECKSRPSGLNTVNMLKVASSALGFGPQMAMQLAERLYTQGFIRTRVEFAAGRELFHCVGQHVTAKGFTSIMPWMAVGEKNLPQFTKGEKINILKVDLYEGSTSPPDYLSESELISLMEKNGIGTDASIPVHINNICERNYVQVSSGRRLVPTALGTTLIRGYQCIDPDLCLPDIRSFIEQQITLIAKGKADHIHVVQHVLQQFKQKYTYFVKKIENMDALFEAQFSPLADSGRLLSKCGKCTRYMKYISTQPPRLYCATCEEVYYLPQNGTIKLYKELACPLDGFELVLFLMAGPDGKTFPLCPYCYNSPPFEGIDKLFGALKLGSSGKIGKGAGMPCFLCPHPTCQHSLISQGVCACPECSGTLVLDPVSAPKWRLYCNICNCLVSLPQGAHRISTTGKRCPECDSTIIEVDFNKRTTPLSNGATLHVGCILCDELLHSLVEMKHGKSFFRRGRGRGRGRGRASSRGRGRGRGRSKYEDPKMSFRDF